jgi:ubiquinol-cytochrome c reductase cytochrome c1 subunit
MFQRLAKSIAPQHVVAAGFVLGSGIPLSCSGGGSDHITDDHIPALSYGWPHDGPLSSFDVKSIRRGFQVYREVCASCHSLDKIAFRNLVGVTHSEEEAKKIAESYEIEDGPNDDGEMFERPGKLSDKLPNPYKNEPAARAANNGALPPDLSLMVKARHGGADYVFALLTGFEEPPAGKVMLPGLHYNPYFAGGAIGMESPIREGALEYEDGTPATRAQMAKDVTCFLAWTAEPEHDDRKKAGYKFMIALAIAIGITGFYKRFRWSIYKTRMISYVGTKAPK